MATRTKMDVPSELKSSQLEIVERVKKTGKLRVGVNECTKAIERGIAKLVVIAEDVSPPELVMHLPLLCKEKNIPFTFVSTRKELGEKAGLKVGTSSVALLDEGDAKKDLLELVGKLRELQK